tara:strand:- start:1457 stop:3103 length:1647 start_codon:yes stop_codon:yes gene_type:complete
MRIPTYRQKTARPRQGSGGQISARLNPSAMAAPALAFADASKQLSQAGGQIADFAYKKVLAASETEAAQANADYQIQLQNLEEELLQKKDMVQAEKEFARRSKALQSNYKLSNALGRKSFGSLAASSLTKQSLSFSRRANLKIVDQTKAASDNTVFTSVRNAADINRSDVARLADIVDIRTHLEKVSPIIGAQEATTKLRSAFAETLSGILTNKMNKAVADGQEKNPHDVIENWMAGLDTDPVLKQLDTVVSDKEKAAIGKKLLSIADSIDQRKAREQKLEADRVEKDIKNTRQMIFSVNRDDPKSVLKAQEAYDKMVRLNLFKSRAERTNAELMLGIGDAPGRQLAKENQGDPNVYRMLLSRATSNTLSLAQLDDKLSFLDPGQYKELSAEVERDRSDAERDAQNTVKIAFELFDENMIQDPQLSALSSRAYTAVMNDLKKWQRANRKAGPVELEQETQRLIAQYEPRFEQRKIQIAFSNINALYANIKTSQDDRPFGVTQPNEENLQVVLGQIRKQVANLNKKEDARLRNQLMNLQGAILMATGGQ